MTLRLRPTLLANKVSERLLIFDGFGLLRFGYCDHGPSVDSAFSASGFATAVLQRVRPYPPQVELLATTDLQRIRPVPLEVEQFRAGLLPLWLFAPPPTREPSVVTPRLEAGCE